MTDTAVAVRESDGQMEAIERVLVAGDLSKLTAEQRVSYYRRVCDSLGLNPFTKPFEYITLSGRLVLYARKDATDQLRNMRGISVERVEHTTTDDLYIVTVYGRDVHNRTDSEIGVVAIGGLKGEARANAIMKAVTKAKRRLTLSMSGLGWLDETEVGSIPDARPVDVDMDTGEIRKTPPRTLAEVVTEPEPAPPPPEPPEAVPEPLGLDTEERARLGVEEFQRWLATSGVPIPQAKRVRLAMFPDTSVELDDYQRAELKEQLEALGRDGAV